MGRDLWSIVLLLIVFSPSQAADSSDIIMNEILTVLEKRQAQLNPIWVKYQVEEFQTGKSQEAFVSPPGSKANLKDRQKQLPDVRFTVEAEIARKGKMFRTSHQGPLVAKGKLVQTKNPFVHVFNGDITICYDNSTNGLGHYAISRNAREARGYTHPWSICREELLLTVLREWKAGKTKYRTVKADNLRQENRDSIVYLEQVYDNGWSNKIWLFRDLDYSIKCFEVYNDKKQLLSKCDQCNYEVIDGMPYPKTAIETYYRASTGAMWKESKLRVLKVETKNSKIPDDLFKLEIPAGVKVFDRDKRMFQSDLPSASLRPRGGPRIRKIVAFVFGVAGVTLVGWYAWNRFYRKSKSSSGPMDNQE